MDARRADLTFNHALERQNERFRELILYVCNKLFDAESFGAVKLNKILYHSDFRAFERLGRPITGMRYFKLENGPAPKAMVPVRREMIEHGLVRLDVRNLGGVQEHRLMALRQANLELFSTAELEIVDEVIRELRPQAAVEVSMVSHDVRWRVLALGDDMPYDFVYLDDSEADEALIRRTEELADQHGWR